MPHASRAPSDLHSRTRLSAQPMEDWPAPSSIPPSSDHAAASGVSWSRRSIRALFAEEEDEPEDLAPREDDVTPSARPVEVESAPHGRIMAPIALGLAFVGGTLGGATGGGAMVLGENIAASVTTPWIKFMAITGVVAIALALFLFVLGAVHRALGVQAIRPEIRLPRRFP